MTYLPFEHLISRISIRIDVKLKINMFIFDMFEGTKLLNSTVIIERLATVSRANGSTVMNMMGDSFSYETLNHQLR